MRPQAFHIASLIALFARGTAGSESSARREALDTARTNWKSNGASDYDLVFRRVCFCTEDYRGPFRVRVRGGSVESATFLEGSCSDEEVPEDVLLHLPTVDGLFELIDKEIGEDPARLDVAYDGTFGFPTRIEIDRSEMIADDEMRYLVSEYDAAI